MILNEEQIILNDNQVGNGFDSEPLTHNIVLRAVKDYRESLIRQKNGATNFDKFMSPKEIERDLLSEWGQFLTHGKSEFILEEVRKSVFDDETTAFSA